MSSRYASDPVLAPLLHDFLAGLPQQVAELGDALTNHSDALATRLSHRLKGDAATYDLPAVAKLAHQVEECLLAGRRPDAGLIDLLQGMSRRAQEHP